jgi:hypothetical protein
MTRIKLILLLCVFVRITVSAQVKIGDNPNTINGASLLELETTNKGFVPPRVALTALNSPNPLPAGLITGTVIFNTATGVGTGVGLYFWNGTAWVAVGSGTLGSGWLTAGNDNTTVTTNSFLGTVAGTAVPLLFKAQGDTVGYLGLKAAANSVSFGVGASGANTATKSVAIGPGAQAKGGNEAVALGSNASAGSFQDIAIGANSLTANNSSNIAIGSGAQATSSNAIAIGSNAQASTNSISLAIGVNSKATGANSSAFGSGTIANNNSTTAVGAGAQATGSLSNALGVLSTASGASSLSVGYNTSSSGINSLAIGNASQATKQTAAVIGFGSSATGIGSKVIGNVATASGANSLILGDSSSATGDSTVIIGGNITTAASNVLILGSAAKKIGIGTIAPGFKLSVIDAANPLYLSGVQATSSFTTDSILTILNGVVKKAPNSSLPGNVGWSINGNSNTSAGTNFVGTSNQQGLTFKVNNVQAGFLGLTASSDATSFGVNSNAVFQSTAIGSGAQATGSNSSLAVGYQALALNQNSIAIGTNDTASANESIAIGLQARANAFRGIAIGASADVSGSTQNIAIGYNSNATSFNGIAIGLNAAATASNNTVAIGVNSVSSGLISMAIGNTAQATGQNSTAFGSASTASAQGANTFGNSSSASGTNSLAVGNGSTSSGSNSIAVGDNSTASDINAIVIGNSGQATKQNATVLGFSSSASGIGATVLGNNSSTTGANSIILGTNSSTGGDSTTVIGNNLTVPSSNVLILGGLAKKIGMGTVSPTEKVDIVGNVKFSGALMPNNLPGASGQVLTSAGAGNPPTWQPATSLTSFSATAPLTYNSATGAFGITQATTSTNGYLNSTDWNTFNNKVSNITLTGPAVIYNTPINFVVSGGTATGTFSLISQPANTILASPDGSSGTPVFRSLVAGDIPAGSGNYIQNGTSIQATSNFNISGNGTIGGRVTSNGGITNSGTLTSSGGIVTINANSNTATNINAGTSTGTVTIGNAANSVNLPKLTASSVVFTDASKNLTSSPTPSANTYLFYNGTNLIWQALGTTDWLLAGNAGTTPGTNFIGTTDAQDFVVKTGGTERMRTLAAGNIGIGTATPPSALSVLATTNPLYLSGVQTITSYGPNDSVLTINAGVVKKATPGAGAWTILGNSGTTPGTHFIGTTDAKDFVIKTNNTEKMRILGAVNGSSQEGWVGIGAAVPRSRLDVTGSFAAKNVVTIQNTSSQGYSSIDMYDNTGSNLSGTFGFANSGVTNTAIAGRDYFFIYANDFLIGTNANNNGVLYIKNSGNIGMGTTNPPNTLSVLAASNPLYLSGVQTTSTFSSDSVLVINAGLVKKAATTANVWSITGNTNTVPGTNFIGTTDAQDFVVKTSGTERMRTLATGNVGIGTPAPPNALSVLAASNPLYLSGVQATSTLSSDSVLTINAGVVKKTPSSSFSTGGGGSVGVSFAINSAGNISLIANGDTPFTFNYPPNSLVTRSTVLITPSQDLPSNVSIAWSRVIGSNQIKVIFRNNGSATSVNSQDFYFTVTTVP